MVTSIIAKSSHHVGELLANPGTDAQQEISKFLRGKDVPILRNIKSAIASGMSIACCAPAFHAHIPRRDETSFRCGVANLRTSCARRVGSQGILRAGWRIGGGLARSAMDRGRSCAQVVGRGRGPARSIAGTRGSCARDRRFIHLGREYRHDQNKNGGKPRDRWALQRTPEIRAFGSSLWEEHGGLETPGISEESGNRGNRLRPALAGNGPRFGGHDFHLCRHL
jgi:hypothetical protein